MSEEEGYSFLMPFVTVVTNGGPHDDVSYAAGWEMGALDEFLRSTDKPVRQYIHTENVKQADLIAMKHGVASEIGEDKDGWSYLTIDRAGGGK